MAKKKAAKAAKKVVKNAAARPAKVSSVRKKTSVATAEVLPPPETKEKDDFLVFKDGLYYPFIDIHNQAWLKTAFLYWDSLTTIVPEDFGHYRTSTTSQELESAGFLNPEFVAPGMRELEDAANDAVTFLDSPEGQSLIAAARTPRPVDASRRWNPEAIHSRKLLDRLVSDLRRRGIEINSDGDWLHVPGWFARYYMTVLATRLAHGGGQTIVTDDLAAEPLANRAVRGDANTRVPADIAQGLLATLVLQTVHIEADTPVTKLLRFKDRHETELGQFRTALREMLKPVKGDLDAIRLQKHLGTVYSDQLRPALENVRGRLTDNRITCGYNNLRASTLLSASGTALSTALGTLALGPFGLLGGVGVSMLLSIGNYQLQRREILRSSPYSYVLRAEEQFGRNDTARKSTKMKTSAKKNKGA